MDFPGICPAWLHADFHCPFFDIHSNYNHSLKLYKQSISKEVGSTIENEKGDFKITLDVQHFRSNEINVKISNNEIIVEGKHEERPDTHGFIARQFKRRYPLPSHCLSENVTSTLSSDGILTIIAEKRPTGEIEKIVPIKMCGSSSRKSQIETKITPESCLKTQKENISEAEDITTKNKIQIMKEDHSRLLNTEILKETKSDLNGTSLVLSATKDSIDTAAKNCVNTMNTSAKNTTDDVMNTVTKEDFMKTTVKSDPLNIGCTTSKIEESIGKSILGLTGITEQLGQSSLASTSQGYTMKSVSEMCANKVKSETESQKDMSEMCGKKSASVFSDMKGAAENSIKAMSKTLIEESSSSYNSCLSSVSTKTVTGKSGESISDIITAELREASENV